MEGTYNPEADLRGRPKEPVPPRLGNLLRATGLGPEALWIAASATPAPARSLTGKFEARGKFLFLDDEKLFIKAVSLSHGWEEANELAQIRSLGANVVFLENPNDALLMACEKLGLSVVVPLGLRQCFSEIFQGSNNAFRSWLKLALRQIEMLNRYSGVIAIDLDAVVSGAVLRFLGAGKYRAMIEEAYRQLKSRAANRLVTCSINSSEARLNLSFLDFYSIKPAANSLSEYRKELAVLQQSAGDKALLVIAAELNATAQQEPDAALEHVICDQIRLSFFAGAAGLCLDLTRNVASAAVKATFADSPFPSYLNYPAISVVICAYNGEEWIEECLDGCSAIDYPNFEVILVDDGSSDHTLALAESKAKKYGFKVLAQAANGGLSAARNRGMEAASGEIIAYLDQDAYPDEHWLRYLAITFLSTQAAVVGGPNINPLCAGPLSDCVDQAPGNSQIVMRDAESADHIPGCNLAVRKAFMKSIGGFDLRYRYGGDDVNFCWKVIKSGGRLAVSPGAMIWHYRRKNIASFWRQQKGYGKGEAVLERDWPERFNSLGHQVFKAKPVDANSAATQQNLYSSSSAIYQTMNGGESFLKLWLKYGPSMPEWPVLLLLTGALAALGMILQPFLLFVPILICCTFLWLKASFVAGWSANLRFPSLKSRLLLAFLHMAQPLARLQGRIAAGMTPWRSRCQKGFVLPKVLVTKCGAKPFKGAHNMQYGIERKLKAHALPLIEGDSHEKWDWQIDGGLFGGVGLLLNNEANESFVRVEPLVSPSAKFFVLLSGLCIILSVVAGSWPASTLFAILNVSLAYGVLRHQGEAFAAVRSLLCDSEIVRDSIWSQFVPPRHFFEEPGAAALPVPETLGLGSRELSFERFDFAPDPEKCDTTSSHKLKQRESKLRKTQ